MGRFSETLFKYGHRLCSIDLLPDRDAQAWLERSGPRSARVELVDVACPGRARRDAVAAFWNACGQPSVLLRGDPAWVQSGSRFLASLGAGVEVQPDAMQLELI